MVGARVWKRIWKLADGVYCWAARSLSSGADAEVTMLCWRDKCWGSG